MDELSVRRTIRTLASMTDEQLHHWVEHMSRVGLLRDVEDLFVAEVLRRHPEWATLGEVG